MDRRNFLIHTTLFTAGSMLSVPALAARNNLSFTSLRRNTGFFSGQGGTIGWLASKDAFVIVDSQFPSSAKECLDGLQKKTSHPLNLLINTHHHGDHTNGNTIFRSLAEQMVAHENVPRLMKKAIEQNNNSENEPAYPTSTFTKSWQMEVGDETVHARHYGPAHTSGDSVIYFEKANVIHMGDLVFNRMNPYTDRPSGASIHNWINVLERAMDEYPPDAIYIFGHGKPEFGVTGERKDVAVMRDYLTSLVEHVKSGVKQGRSKEEVIDKNTMEGFDDFLYADWWSLSNNLEIVYEEVNEQ